MNTAPGPLVGHNLNRRHIEFCKRYLADTRLAAEPLHGCFHILAPFLPRGVCTLLAVTDRHVVLLSISRSSGSTSHTAVSRAVCRLAAATGATAPTEGPTRSLALSIEGHDKTLLAHDADVAAIQRVMEPGPQDMSCPESAPEPHGPHARTSAATDRVGHTAIRLHAKVASVAAVVLAGVIGAMNVVQQDQAESLRRSFDAYLHAIDNARPEDALRFLTPHSRRNLDRARWYAKFNVRSPRHVMQIDHIRMSADGLTAKVATTGGRQGLARKVSVQTWKKLQGSWYRAYLEDIPDMTLRSGSRPGLGNSDLLGAR